MKFVDVGSPWTVRVLYDLLKERTPSQSISHTKMPTWKEHVSFVASKPYKFWKLIVVENDAVGSVYLTDRHEVGIFIFNKYQGSGYGKRAIEKLLEEHKTILANVNPENTKSRKLWEGLGGKLIQVTYSLGDNSA